MIETHDASEHLYSALVPDGPINVVIPASTPRSAAKTGRSKTGRLIVSVKTPKTQKRETSSDVQLRTLILIEALGSQARVAELLDVSRSQPGKWSKGEEAPSAENAREIIDLDHVVARVSAWLGQSMTFTWLNGSNAFLDGARPIDVLKTRGSSEVIAALDAEMSGAYA